MKETILAYRKSGFLLGHIAFLLMPLIPSAVVAANNDAPTPSVISVNDYASRVVHCLHLPSVLSLAVCKAADLIG